MREQAGKIVTTGGAVSHEVAVRDSRGVLLGAGSMMVNSSMSKPIVLTGLEVRCDLDGGGTVYTVLVSGEYRDGSRVPSGWFGDREGDCGVLVKCSQDGPVELLEVEKWTVVEQVDSVPDMLGEPVRAGDLVFGAGVEMHDQLYGVDDGPRWGVGVVDMVYCPVGEPDMGMLTVRDVLPSDRCLDARSDQFGQLDGKGYQPGTVTRPGRVVNVSGGFSSVDLADGSLWGGLRAGDVLVAVAGGVPDKDDRPTVVGVLTGYGDFSVPGGPDQAVYPEMRVLACSLSDRSDDLVGSVRFVELHGAAVMHGLQVK